MTKEKQIRNYKEFVDSLVSNLDAFGNKPISEWQDDALKCVDGLAAEELRRLVDIETRRKYGVFFTNSELVKKVFNYLKPDFNSQSVIYDPACGAANLIIGAYNFICEKKIKLDKAEHFLGTDLHKEFIEAAKLRCSINQLLLLSNASNKPAIINPIFSFSQADGLLPNNFYSRATDVIVNPPFNLISVEEDLKWSKGKVSAAALFMDKIIQNINPGTNIYAILPDVLRSGSRYNKWRKMLNEKCVTGPTKLLGQFDKHADVDVFAIKLTKRKKAFYFSIKEHKARLKTIDELFDIHVGPVVDYRDAKKGPKYNYIVSKRLKGWSTFKKGNLYRKHQGTHFLSPFVVVKRTSRMGDSQRAVATIINMSNPVYVDNHLIVVTPKSKTLRDCKKLMEILKDNRTNKWLNQKIRCRHLTVKLISKIPIWQ